MDTCNKQSDNVFGPLINGCRDSHDLTLLFEQAILSSLPSCLAIIAAGASILRLWRRSVKTVSGDGYSSVVLVTILAGLLANSIIQIILVVQWTMSTNGPTTFSIPASSISLLLSLIFAVQSFFNHTRSIRPSSILSVYLILSIILDSVQTRTLWLRREHNTNVVAIVFTIGVGIKVFILPFTMLGKKKYLRMPYAGYPPEALGGVVNRSFFWWINSLLVKGSSARLKVDDLFNLDEKLKIEHVGPKFKRSWDNVIKRKKRHNAALLFTLLRCFSTNILIISGFRFALIGFKFCQPLLINRAISLLLEPESPNTTQTGRLLIGATSLIYIGIAITTGAFRHHVYRLITMIRASLVDVIYEKTLRLDASIVKDSAALTLMSTDIERVGGGFEVFDALWASPFEIGIAMVLLYREIGLVFIVPVAISIVFILIPISMRDTSASAQRIWVEATQHRVSTTASILHKMKSIKMTGLSSSIGEHIQSLRVSELEVSAKFRAVLSASITISIMSQVVIPFATLVAYVLMQQEKNKFDTTTAFTALALVALLANPIKDIARAVPEVAAAVGCLGRIQKYLCARDLLDQADLFPSSFERTGILRGSEGLELERISSRYGDEPLVKIGDASFAFWNSERKPMLKGVSLTISPSTWTVITGPVGSGKSTLLLAMMNELQLLTGSINSHLPLGSSYCSQDPWLPNLTIQQIITSQSTFNQERYQRILDVCLLRRDIDNFLNGDATVIGNSGVSLSGGQKQRLSLARALYSRRSLVLLDDVLGGLDATSEQALVENLFGSGGFLRGDRVASVLVTYASRHARRADHVIVMEKGVIVEQGSPDQITLFEGDTSGGTFKETLPTTSVKRTEVTTTCDNTTQPPNNSDAQNPGDTRDIQSELASQTGDIRLYKYYLSSLGWSSVIAQTICILSFAVFLKLPAVWVRWWAEAEMMKNIESVSPTQTTEWYIGIYALICGLCLLSFSLFIIIMFQYGIPQSSNRLHYKLVKALINAPYWFLVSTDAGQITNRFSQDMSLLCLQLPFAFTDTLLNVGVCLVGMILITMASKYSATICPAFLVLLYILQKFYLRTSRQIRLLDLEAKSPIYSHFMQTLQGLTTIRAFGWQRESREENAMLLNTSQRPFYLMYCIQRWLNLVLDLLVAGVATIIVTLATQLGSLSSSSGALGVSLLGIVTFSQDLTYLIRTWTDLETSLGAVARIREFERGTACEHLEGESEVLGSGWPCNGEIAFQGLSSGYSKESQSILDGLSFVIKPGTKVGICGRTGSGKSTFLLTILRMTEIHKGDILIDNTSIQTIPRNTLRRHLFAMPQDPLFLPGSIRYNVDPFSEHSDDAIRSALEQVGLLDVVITKLGVRGLDMDVDSLALSKGQQQLFCLSRAVLSKARVVLLDEITSSVDEATEAVMMDVVERVFVDRTVIAIAHRLKTIRGFDEVVVLDRGRFVESGEPGELISRRGWFWRLWEDNRSSS